MASFFGAPRRTKGGNLVTSPNLEGVQALMTQLEELQMLDDGKVLRAGARAAGRVVMDAARARIPVGEHSHYTYKKRLVGGGFSKRNISMKVSLSKDKQAVTLRVGTRAEAFYAPQFVELGTKWMPARPWLRPAFYASAGAAQKAFADQLRKHIKKAVAKGKSKGKK